MSIHRHLWQLMVHHSWLFTAVVCYPFLCRCDHDCHCSADSYYGPCQCRVSSVVLPVVGGFLMIAAVVFTIVNCLESQYLFTPQAIEPFMMGNMARQRVRWRLITTSCTCAWSSPNIWVPIIITIEIWYLDVPSTN